MPPFLGFFSKFYLFLVIVKTFNFSLVVFLMLIASISVFYYLRVLKLVFFEIQQNNKINMLFQGNFLYAYKDISMTTLCLSLILIFYLFLCPTYLILFCKYITIGFLKL